MTTALTRGPPSAMEGRAQPHPWLNPGDVPTSSDTWLVSLVPATNANDRTVTT